MFRTRAGWAGLWSAAAAMVILAGAMGLAFGQQDKAAAEKADTAKAAQVTEVKTLLAGLAVDPPRKHKNMLVFPIRFSGKQAPGEWTVLDEATAAGELKVSEKDQASVPEVLMENTGAKSVLIMSGEIIKGGKQTRMAAKDAVIETKGKVAVAVFCVEQHRWSGGKDFKASNNMAPAAIKGALIRGAGQAEVWAGVREMNRTLAPAAPPPTDSLEEGLESPEARERKAAAHKALGKFSPPDTIGIAVADARTGRVAGMELFGRRDLFERLQEKLIEGYALDLVPASVEWNDADAKKVTEKDVEAFIVRVLEGTSKYEDTPGSGRGIDLTSGTVRGKGVALGDNAIHLSVQDLRAPVTPAKPIVDRPPAAGGPGAR